MWIFIAVALTVLSYKAYFIYQIIKRNKNVEFGEVKGKKREKQHALRV